MTFAPRRWTSLALGAALLAACGEGEAGEAGEAGESGNATAASPSLSAGAGERGEGEGGEGGEGEGGEGGEGGIDLAAAASDAGVFRTGLAIVEAHVLAARDAYAAGRAEAAAEMFAHPIGEVLLDMEPVLVAQGVEPFDGLLLSASQAAIAGESVDAIGARSDAILAALGAAEQQAPGENDGRADAVVAADQIERAVQQYRRAIEFETYEPYLDGYGFVRTAAAIRARSGEAMAAAAPETTEAIDAALVLLEAAYPGVERPDALGADISALTVANSNVQLALGGE
ncbi:MAG: hypothetical protein AAFX03_12095 [Pseudomonadota bacterium]